MPALSPTMKEGNLAKWHKKNGDAVKVGDLLAEIETDKATMEIESDYDGVIDKILYSEGSENIAVGSDLAIIIEEGSSVINDKLENQANNKYIDDQAPWKLKNTDINRMNDVLWILIECIRRIGIILLPFIPESANKILDQISAPKHERYFKHLNIKFSLNEQITISNPSAVFPRYIN